jgi:starvation-inducible DNA-binding protein
MDKLITSLQRAFANVVNEYLHAHGFHWNVVGKDFPQLHEFFQEIYEDVYGSIDPLAEILRKLDVKSPFQLSQFAALKTTSEADPEDAEGMVKALFDMNNQVIASLNLAFKEANTVNQQGVCNFIAERIDMHQKWAWQLRSTLG